MWIQRATGSTGQKLQHTSSFTSTHLPLGIKWCSLSREKVPPNPRKLNDAACRPIFFKTWPPFLIRVAAHILRWAASYDLRPIRRSYLRLKPRRLPVAGINWLVAKAFRDISTEENGPAQPGGNYPPAREFWPGNGQNSCQFHRTDSSESGRFNQFESLFGVVKKARKWPPRMFREKNGRTSQPRRKMMRTLSEWRRQDVWGPTTLWCVGSGCPQALHLEICLV